MADTENTSTGTPSAPTGPTTSTSPAAPGRRYRPRGESNLGDRINEARDHGWLGEVDGLQTSLAAATEKLTNLDRINTRAAPGRTDLGMPTLPTVGG
jgi:hypothetical protein